MWWRKNIRLLVLILSTFFCLCLFLYFGAKRRKKKEEMVVSVREPAVAGVFYPGQKEELKKAIANFLERVEVFSQKGELKILIVPHAGYRYSGLVAASGFAQIKGNYYSTVVLLGSAHQAYFEGAVVADDDIWRTPLGDVLIDKKLGEEIVKTVEGVSFSSLPHFNEHSLEVELPFLQFILPSFKIVPILLGETDEQVLEKLADFLGKNLGAEMLIVISSDLSHYPPYKIAKEVDQRTIEAILSGDPENFEATVSAQMKKGYSNLVTCACGEKAIKVGMMVAQKLEGNWRLIRYANSGDSGGERGRVVGYGALGYYTMVLKLSREQKKKLLAIARQTLESYLKEGKIPNFKVKDRVLNQKVGAFVTLRKKGELRGCIGQIQPSVDPLWKVIRRMAIDSALHDARFPPLRAEELKEIEIEISVLSPPKRINDPLRIQLGKQGVIVKKGFHSGVFLPQVATETGWDLETFLGQLCRQKAGLSWDCWKREGVEIYVFTAQVFAEGRGLQSAEEKEKVDARQKKERTPNPQDWQEENAS